jgi:hypothetical protein
MLCKDQYYEVNKVSGRALIIEPKIEIHSQQEKSCKIINSVKSIILRNSNNQPFQVTRQVGFVFLALILIMKLLLFRTMARATHFQVSI